MRTPGGQRSPIHWGGAGRPQTAAQTVATWSLPMGAVGDGSPSGGGSREGFVADTRRGNRWWVHRALQRPEDLLDHLALRDGGDEPQRPLRSVRAARPLHRQDAREQLRRARARRSRVGLLLVHPLRAWRRDAGPPPGAVPCRLVHAARRGAPPAGGRARSLARGGAGLAAPDVEAGLGGDEEEAPLAAVVAAGVAVLVTGGAGVGGGGLIGRGGLELEGGVGGVIGQGGGVVGGSEGGEAEAGDEAFGALEVVGQALLPAVDEEKAAAEEPQEAVMGEAGGHRTPGGTKALGEGQVAVGGGEQGMDAPQALKAAIGVVGGGGGVGGQGREVALGGLQHAGVDEEAHAPHEIGGGLEGGGPVAREEAVVDTGEGLAGAGLAGVGAVAVINVEDVGMGGGGGEKGGTGVFLGAEPSQEGGAEARRGAAVECGQVGETGEGVIAQEGGDGGAGEWGV